MGMFGRESEGEWENNKKLRDKENSKEEQKIFLLRSCACSKDLDGVPDVKVQRADCFEVLI